MKFSIVTAVLNRASTIRDCIESVARQIGDVDGLQHVIVDGGSDDGTLEILADYPHLEVIHEPTRGIYVAMNRGLAAARHDVVGIVNSDDRLEAGALRHVAQCFAAHPDVEVVAGRGIVERDGPQGRSVVGKVPRHGHRGQSWDLLFHGSTAINARFFRHSLLTRLGNFDTSFPLAADRELLIRQKLAEVAVLTDDRVLYRYLEHDGSATLNAAARHDHEMRREHLAIAEKYLQDGQLRPGQRRRFQHWTAAERARLTLARLATRDWTKAWREAKAGLTVAPLSFLTFLLRRALVTVRSSLRRG